MTKEILMVDPPEGWKYGFPAPLEECYQTQLEKSNYPEELKELALKHSRYWVVKADD